MTVSRSRRKLLEAKCLDAVEVNAHKLKDATAAAKLVSEMFMKPFRNRYLQQGLYVVFVDCEHWPEQIEAGDAIQKILKQRKL